MLDTDPVLELGCPFLAEKLGVDLQQIRPLVGPVIGECVAGEKGIDFSLSFCL
jgi:hypothetical protein